MEDYLHNAVREQSMKTKMTRFVLTFLLAAASMAPACSVIANWKSVVERKDMAPLTVHGILVKTGPGTLCGQPYLHLYFQVKKAFGAQIAVGDTVAIATPSNSAMCGVNYPIGAEVIVFTGKASFCQGPSEPWFTSLGSYNVQAPTPGQVDSLYGVLALQPRNEGGRRVGRVPEGGFPAGTPLFKIGRTIGDDWRGADGKARKP